MQASDMQVNEEFIRLLEFLCRHLGVTVDFTNADTIKYAEQILYKVIDYEIISSFAIIVLMIAGITGLFKLAFALKKYDRPDYIKAYEYFFVFNLIVGVFGFCFVVGEVFDIITCLTFPEKAIYEYILDIMSKYGVEGIPIENIQ